MEAIVLAGGLGTRLQSVIGASPKCMAQVNGAPFLHYVLQYIAGQGCRRAILSLGFKHEVVVDWLNGHPYPLAIDHVIEHEPMGTGGGILLAMAAMRGSEAVVLNGDTLFQVNLSELLQFHTQKSAATTLALKQMHDFDRYGVVNTGDSSVITAFEEKQYRTVGCINGGIYVINKTELQHKNLPAKCSFEKDYLEKYVAEGNFYGMTADGYFIDIGVPADYQRAQTDFKTLQL
jgi:D-glycero-alpha-D-manno-heptose 1-phosphate guanylyltransferase